MLFWSKCGGVSSPPIATHGPVLTAPNRVVGGWYLRLQRLPLMKGSGNRAVVVYIRSVTVENVKSFREKHRFDLRPFTRAPVLTSTVFRSVVILAEDVAG